MTRTPTAPEQAEWDEHNAHCDGVLHYATDNDGALEITCELCHWVFRLPK